MVDQTNEAAEANQYPDLQVGDVLSGKVSKIEDKQALVDVGYKFDAILPISEVSNIHIEKISDVLNMGDEIQVKVKKLNHEKDELVVSKRAIEAEKSWDELAAFMQSGKIFEATVAEVVKGGLVVDVGLRGFVPASQVELNFVENFSHYKGRTLRLKVIELDKENNRVILSQRAVLEQDQQKQQDQLIEGLSVGQILEGRVARITDFGAFVDLGGVDGLIHVSELSWEHVDHPSKVVKEGDLVKVQVLRVDRDNHRISLSLKATLPSPWDKTAGELKPGSIVRGVVKRLASFGAFVEIQPGIEGLVHISQISSRRVGSPGEVLKVGQEVEAKVLDVNIAEKRISLSMKELEESPEVDQAVQMKLEESKGLGVSIGDLIGDELRKKLK